MSAQTSLHELAPRLARARDVERWNIWCAGEDRWLGVNDGDRWAETVSSEHSTERCRCGGTVDHYRIHQRILVGQNRNHVRLILSWKCRVMRGGSCVWRSSHR